MSNTLLSSLDLIGPGDLVIYHGTIEEDHGLWIAAPCPCLVCVRLDEIGFPDVRFALIDPWTQSLGPVHARRESITRSITCG